MKKIIGVWLSLFFIAGCLERELPTETVVIPSVQLVKKSVPNVINPGRSYVVAVALTGESDRAIPFVTLEVLRETNGEKLLTVNCMDDGDQAHTGNGDVVAFDNIYSGKLIWPAGNIGLIKLVFHFSAPGTEATVLKVPVTSQDMHPPVLQSVSCPDSLASGFSGLKKIEAMVQDSTGVTDILGVLVTGFRSGIKIFSDTLYDDGSHSDPTPYDGRCTKMIDKTFSAGKSGQYELHFQAQDKAGLTSEVVKRMIHIDNGVPLLQQVVFEEQVQRPSTGTVTFLIEAHVDDPQGLADVKQVKMSWRKPDYTYPAASPYMLYDNGLPFDLSKWDYGYRGDVTAHDGVYSIRGVFDSDDLLGDYTLGFLIEDLVGNKSTESFYKVKLK